MSTGPHRPASHPVLQRMALSRPPLDELITDDVIESIARLTARLRPPLTVAQQREVDTIARALRRLADGGAL